MFCTHWGPGLKTIIELQQEAQILAKIGTCVYCNCNLLPRNRESALGRSVLSQKCLWFQSPLYMRESSPYISGTPANVLWSNTTFRIAVICQQKRRRAGGERVRKRIHSR